MKQLKTMWGGLLMLALMAVGCLPKAKHRAGLIGLANIAEGTHEGAVTYKADAVISTRFLLGKIGTDSAHVNLAGAADIPIGVITDEASEIEDGVNVNLLGSSKSTQKMVAGAAIAAGAFVVPTAGGKVITLPASAGTYYIVGRALGAAAADDDEIEVDPIPCVQRVVA